MSAADGDEPRPARLGDVVLANAALESGERDDSVLFAGTIRALSPETGQVTVALQWRSDGAPVLIGSSRDFAVQHCYDPRDIGPIMEESEQGGTDALWIRKRVDAALTLWGLWFVERETDPQAEMNAALTDRILADEGIVGVVNALREKAIEELGEAIQMAPSERAIAVYSARLHVNALEHGTERPPAIVPDPAAYHDASEHRQFGACRYCSATVAAAWRASHGKIPGIKVRAPEGAKESN